MRRSGRAPARLALFVGVTFAVSPTHATAQEPHPAPPGERRTLPSAVLGEERGYWVSLPASYDDTIHAQQAYPVLYLLDAEWNFRWASAAVDFMAENGQIPELIVVGVPHQGQRLRDMTPTRSLIGDDGREHASLAVSGGGGAFLRFLWSELFPEIESRYRTRPYRILVGHSMGGLIALHALVHDRDLFDAYVVVDPSLWWDGQRLLGEVPAYFATARLERKALFLAKANTATPALPAFMVHSEGISRFDTVMAREDRSGIHYAFRYYDDEGHGSVPLPALHEGLKHVFEGYWLSYADLYGGLDAVPERYRRLSDRLGLELHPGEAMIDGMAEFELEELESPETAIPMLELNVRSYPRSWHAHAALATALEAAGDTAQAVLHLTHALELKPGDAALGERLRALGRR